MKATLALRGSKMRIVPFVLIFAAVSHNAVELCETGQYTNDGKCCSMCPPGEGVKTPCGAEDTECEQCMDSVSYSDVSSHTEPCKPCTMCLGTRTIEIPCMDNFDTSCICMDGYYEDPDNVGGQCLQCDLCDEGYGVLERCAYKQNTICEKCPPDTFSDQKSSADPCLPCTACEENEILISECTPVKDAMCASYNPRFTRVNTVVPLKSVTTTEIMTTTAVPSSPQFIGQGNNNSIIPVYCSILAAVVVGLVAYVAFKRWNSCKQNKQGANNRTVNQTPSPEGEKLHNDSGISVDSQSLQEQQQKLQQQQQQQQQQQNQAARVEPSLYTALPPHKQEEVEQLLNSCKEDAQWCNLAGLLGYNEEHIDTFKQEEHPVRALLSDWAAKDSATTDALCTALRKLKRDDIVETLNSEPTATSAV
ncbi:tumor necrosis factor receptor superfamily member 16-like isoform X2 [Carcharodon carcharias]|uniref:tumor necrosis factor receptor superfamily member 16-like isoform X2 n=1 Tax=Carcharodon carcharias TaxID=13397 RepID=UPI001B7EC903|nr:tumor necrosis factor receptor superfamily member 16-like isoform X2 [Carcharodon carcharias]